MEFENTIGLETHVQLKTNTKMFCSCLLKTGCEPNTNVCPVCLGYPGALPVMNKEAVKLAVMSGMMLGCEVNRHATFDRKNYFYPDMAKDYQISENGNPLCLGGGIEIVRADGTKKFIRINHIHLEEDAAKINHYATTSGVDFNRGGTPLMEIVSEPDMESADDAIAYLTALKEMLVYAGVSDCNLEEGNMRSDVNISIRPKGDKPGVLPVKADGSIDFSKLGTKVEIKNMNSFSGIHAALVYEAKRQRACVARSVPIVQETRRWDPEATETASMRSKENAHDYRYFPEPDLVPVELSEEQISEWRKLLPEKPEARRARMIADYGIAEYDAEVLSQHKANADYFERTCGAIREKARGKGEEKKCCKQLCNLFMGDVMALMNATGKAIDECVMKPEELAALSFLATAGTINGPTLKELLPEIFEKGGDPEAIVRERGLGAVSDTGALEAFVDQAVAANPGPVADFKAGKKAAAGFFVGQVMKLSQGKADPKLVGQIVAKKLGALS
jgi:aspartyl-tRNA(Asn)/glutamyl-tRNA(Gln) amidotransferase subunit B